MNKILYSLLLTIFLTSNAFSADRKFLKDLNRIKRASNQLSEFVASNDPINFDEGARQLNSYIDAYITPKIASGEFKIPKKILSDVQSLIKLIKKLNSANRKEVKKGTALSSITESVTFQADQAEALYELVQNPSDVQCIYDVLYKVYTSESLNYPRTEVNVTCNRSFDELSVSVLPGSTAGQIGSVVRFYKFGGYPDPFGSNGGSGSCTNNGVTAGCIAFEAKAGGTAMMQLGIYDNPGLGLALRVSVKRRGVEIDFDDAEAG